MPAYKDKKRGTWYANFYYQDWTGERKHKCKRGFKTQREAKEYERNFLDQQSKSSDILFSNLIENYLEDMAHRLKPTTIENKRYLIEGKLLPYFGKLKICDIDTITVRNWQNMLLNATDDQGRPYSQTYLKTINNQLSAALNYAVKHYRLASNPCQAAGSIGKSNAEEMNIWTRESSLSFSFPMLTKTPCGWPSISCFIPVCDPGSCWPSRRPMCSRISGSTSIRIMPK